MTLRRRDWLLLTLGALIVITASLGPQLVFGSSWQMTPYNQALLVPNYLEHGFVRRGLAGTLYALMGWVGGAQSADDLFQLFRAVWIAVPLTLLVRRLSQTEGSRWIWLSIVLLAAPQIFWGWAKDIGRPDMLVGGLMVWSLLFALRGRYISAVIPLLIGALVHETAIIYGVPLLLAAGFLDYRQGTSSAPHLLTTALLLAGSVAAILIAQSALSAPPQTVAAAMLERGPPEDLGTAAAAYATVGGLRAITGFLCTSYARKATPLFLAANLCILALYLPVLLLWSRRSILLVAFTALAPMAAISCLGIDYGRWETFAVFNAWLTAAMIQIKRIEPSVVSRQSYIMAALVLVALVAMRTPRILVANGLTQRMGQALWGQRGVSPVPLKKCDPTWRSVIVPRKALQAPLPTVGAP